MREYSKWAGNYFCMLAFSFWWRASQRSSQFCLTANEEPNRISSLSIRDAWYRLVYASIFAAPAAPQWSWLRTCDRCGINVYCDSAGAWWSQSRRLMLISSVGWLSVISSVYCTVLQEYRSAFCLSHKILRRCRCWTPILPSVLFLGTWSFPLFLLISLHFIFPWNGVRVLSWTQFKKKDVRCFLVHVGTIFIITDLLPRTWIELDIAIISVHTSMTVEGWLTIPCQPGIVIMFHERRRSGAMLTAVDQSQRITSATTTDVNKIARMAQFQTRGSVERFTLLRSHRISDDNAEHSSFFSIRTLKAVGRVRSDLRLWTSTESSKLTCDGDVILSHTFSWQEPQTRGARCSTKCRQLPSYNVNERRRVRRKNWFQLVLEWMSIYV